MSETAKIPVAAVPRPQPVQRSLVRKLAEVMGEIERIPKSGWNDFHKYNYATEADIVAAARAGMAKRALMLIPDVEKTDWRDGPIGRDGKSKRICSLTVRFTLEDGESGEERVFRIMGEGEGADDKATYKAMTGAIKYALLKLFLIPTGDDPEREETEPPPRSAQQSAKPVPAPSRVQKVAADVAAKLGGQVNAVKPLPATQTPYQRLIAEMKTHGMEMSAWAPELKRLTGKTSSKEVTDADVDRVCQFFFPEPPPTNNDAVNQAAGESL